MAIRRRHKGEREVDRSMFYTPYDASHPVAHAIRTGSRWFEAWQFQNGLTTDRLSRLISMSPSRIAQLVAGAPILRREVAALAAAYGVQPSDIIASLPDPALLIEGE